MPALRAKHSGVWEFPTPNGRLSGSWRIGKKLWVKNSGIWVVVWEDVTVKLTDHTSDVYSPFNTRAGVSLNSSGVLSILDGGNGVTDADEWATPRNGSPGTRYEAYVDNLTGDSPASGSDATNTWLSLGEGRSWYGETFASGYTYRRSGTYRLRIRKQGTPTILATCTITWRSEGEDISL